MSTLSPHPRYSMGHCSSHEFFAVGCIDCTTSESYRAQAVEKAQGVLRVGTHPLRIDQGHPDPKLQLIRSKLQNSLILFFKEEY